MQMVIAKVESEYSYWKLEGVRVFADKSINQGKRPANLISIWEAKVKVNQSLNC